MKRTNTPWGNAPQDGKRLADRPRRGWTAQEFAQLTWGDLRRGKGGYQTGDHLVDIIVDHNHKKFVEKFHREPTAADPVFFYYDRAEPEFRSVDHILSVMAQEMRASGLPQPLVYAWKKTGLILSRTNRNLHTPEQRREFEAAVKEYQETRRQLLYFDDQRGCFVDTRPIAVWAILSYPDIVIQAEDYDGLLRKLEASVTEIKQYRDLGLLFKYEDVAEGPSYFSFWTTDPAVAAKAAAELELVWHRSTDNPEGDFEDDAMALALPFTGKVRLLLSYQLPGQRTTQDEEFADIRDQIDDLAEARGWHLTATAVVREKTTFVVISLALPEMPDAATLAKFRSEIVELVPVLKMFEVSELNPLDF